MKAFSTLAAAAAVKLAALAVPLSAAAAEYTVMIATWRGCEEACQGLQDYLTGQGLDVEFVIRDADRNADAVAAIHEEARAIRPDLLVTWGTSVTLGVAGTLDDLDDPSFNHDIPQLFMIVADPVGSGIVASLEDTGRANVTGTFNRMPERVTIETIRGYMPDFSHLGLLYNADETNAVLKRDELRDLSKEMDFAFTALQIASGPDGLPLVDDIPAKIAALKEAGADFLYLGSSSFLRENAETLKAASVAQALPVLSPYEALVRDGDALVSVAARYYDVGRLAGAQAERILVDGARPGDLPVVQMKDFAVTINLDVAEEIGLYPPIGLLQIAETVK